MSDIIVGSVGVQLVPSAKGFDAKAKALLKGLVADVDLKLNDTVARKQLDELTHTRTATVNVNVDSAAAEARLDEVARNRTAHINVDSGGLSQANGAFGTLLGLSGLLGSALVPVAGGLTGVAAAAGVAGVAVVGLQKKQKQIDDLRKKAATSTSQAVIAAATAQADALEASLSGTEKAFLGAEQTVKGAFAGLLQQVGPALFQPLTLGLRLIAQLLPQLAPLIVTVSNYFTNLIKSLSAGVRNGGFARFIGYLVNVFPKVMSFLEAFARALGNIFVGLAPAGEVLLGVFAQIFDVLGRMPADVVAPLAAALLGLFGGPVIAAIAGVGVLLLNLYKNSQPFRQAIDGIVGVLVDTFKPIVADLVDFWNTSLLPAIKQLAPVVATLAGGFLVLWANVAKFVLPVILRIAKIVLGIVVPAIRTMLRVFLAVVGGIVNGAANAFGWVPLIGGKLKGAAADFNNFANSVNASLDGITGEKTINIRVEIFRRIREAVIGPKNIATGTSLVTGALTGGVKPTPAPSTTTSVSGGGGGGGKIPKVKGGGSGAAQQAAQARREARNLLAALAKGIQVGGKVLENALNNVLSKIADFPKKFRKQLAGLARDALAQVNRLNSLRESMASLASSIKDAFTPSDLFGGTLGNLRGGLAKALVNVKQALAGQKALIAAGVSPTFLAALMASGNGRLITQLAGDPALAKNFAAQFAEVNTLAAQVGSATGAAVYNPQIDESNKKLTAIEKQLSALAPAIGKEINRNVPRRGSK